jgi:hypothetical protein
MLHTLHTLVPKCVHPGKPLPGTGGATRHIYCRLLARRCKHVGGPELPCPLCCSRVLIVNVLIVNVHAARLRHRHARTMHGQAV